MKKSKTIWENKEMLFKDNFEQQKVWSNLSSALSVVVIHSSSSRVIYYIGRRLAPAKRVKEV